MAFLPIVWGAALSTYVLYGVAPWPWDRGGARWVLLDAWHHVAYVGGTAAGWVVLEAMTRSGS